MVDRGELVNYHPSALTHRVLVTSMGMAMANTIMAIT